MDGERRFVRAARVSRAVGSIIHAGYTVGGFSQMQLPVMSQAPLTPAEARCVKTPLQRGVLKLSTEGYLPPGHPETLVAIAGPASVLLS